MGLSVMCDARSYTERRYSDAPLLRPTLLGPPRCAFKFGLLAGTFEVQLIHHLAHWVPTAARESGAVSYAPLFALLGEQVKKSEEVA